LKSDNRRLSLRRNVLFLSGCVESGGELLYTEIIEFNVGVFDRGRLE
jgi:hypothetical protein